MKAKAVLKDGMHFVGTSESGHTLNWDSAPKGQPTNGPTPMEAILQATAVCSAMDVLAILRKRRKEVASFELDIEAERSDDHPRVFEDLVVVYRVKGNGITRSEVEKAVKLSHDKYCSVINMFKPAVNIRYRVEVL